MSNQAEVNFYNQGFSTAVLSTTLIFLIILSFQTFINDDERTIVIVDHIDVEFDYGQDTNTEVKNSTKEEKDNVFIVFVIPIKPDDFERRQVIRDSWANRSSWEDFEEKTNTTSSNDTFYRTFAIMFIIADPDLGYKEASRETQGNETFEEEQHEPDISELLKKEAERYGDVYDVDGLDEGYTMIKYKVLWGMRQSLVLYNATYIIKTDGDIFVNMPVLIRRLKLASRESVYTGSCTKHSISGHVQDYLDTHGSVPRWKYCSGGGYILSRDVVERIMELSREVAQIPIVAEDMYTGYLIARLQEPEVHAVPNGGWLKLSGLTAVNPGRGQLDKLNAMVFYHGLKKSKLFVHFLNILNEAPFLPAADQYSMATGSIH